MSSQVIEVCMGTLMEVKVQHTNTCGNSSNNSAQYVIFSKKGQKKKNFFKHIVLLHRLLRVFDDICTHANHEGTVDFLIAFLLEQSEALGFLNKYCHDILLDQVTSYPDGTGFVL